MMVAEHRPDRNVQREGTGTSRPNRRRRPAARHQPESHKKASIATIDASTVSGNNSNPLTARSWPGRPPSVTAFVSAL